MSCVVEECGKLLTVSRKNFKIFRSTLNFRPRFRPNAPKLLQHKQCYPVCRESIALPPAFKGPPGNPRALVDLRPRHTVSLFHCVESWSYHFSGTHLADFTPRQFRKQVRLDFRIHFSPKCIFGPCLCYSSRREDRSARTLLASSWARNRRPTIGP